MKQDESERGRAWGLAGGGRRETATHGHDLPHGFDETGFGVHCYLCGRRREDELHTAAPAEQAAEQGRGVTGLQRELGS